MYVWGGGGRKKPLYCLGSCKHGLRLRQVDGHFFEIFLGCWVAWGDYLIIKVSQKGFFFEAEKKSADQEDVLSYLPVL